MNQITFDTLPQAVTNLQETVNNIQRLLLEKSNPPQPETDQLLTVPQAAEFLKLQPCTVYGLVHTATIPVNKRGKRLYFSKQDLTAWIKAGRRKTVSEIAQEAEKHCASKKTGKKQ